MEYFIMANSFAAPFVSDQSSSFVTASSPEEALTSFARDYKHPAGLYAALAYDSANAYHKGRPALAKWLCNHEIEKLRLTKDLGAYSYRGDGPGDFEVDGKRHTVTDPKAGALVPV